MLFNTSNNLRCLCVRFVPIVGSLEDVFNRGFHPRIGRLRDYELVIPSHERFLGLECSSQISTVSDDILNEPFLTDNGLSCELP